MEKTKNTMKLVIGTALFVLGLVLIKVSKNSKDIMAVLPFIFIGVGSGLFGESVGNYFKHKDLLKNPQKARQEYIEEHDERNQALRNKAKAKTYNLFQYIFANILLGFGLMSVDLYIIIVLAMLYLFLTFANIYYINKLQKEM
ncbi:MAG: hypothetical protein GYA87_08435 [Christensenellaceae bacterium]|nr:hypothetical protein [Christensenellaceae bacterium]